MQVILVERHNKRTWSSQHIFISGSTCNSEQHCCCCIIYYCDRSNSPYYLILLCNCTKSQENQKARYMHSYQNRKKISHVNLNRFYSKLYLSCNTKALFANEINGYCQSLYQGKCSHTKGSPLL